MRPLAAIRAYADAADPAAAQANLIALVLAWNTPFYPLYLMAAGGWAMRSAAWFTLASFPVFLAIPALTRRRPLGGRLALVLAGALNTFYCTWLLGWASGTAWFFVPCVVLAAMLFRRGEGRALAGAVAATGCLALAARLFGAGSAVACQGAACGAIAWMNQISVAILLAFFAILLIRSRIHKRAAPAGPSTPPPATPPR